MSTTVAVLLLLPAAVVVGLGVFLLLPLRHPLPTESDYSHRSTPWWHLYYGKKYLRSIKRAAKRSGLEEHFRSQSFDFDGPALAEPRRIVIKAVGDLMARRDMQGDASRHLWDEIGEYLFDADLKLGNLEFAINPNWVIEKIVRYSVPPSYAEMLLGDPRFGRFDLLALANNHINDSLSQGIRSTCDHLDALGLTHVGANRSAAEQDRFPILEVEGIKIAVLAYTFSTNDIPLEPGFEFGTNLVRFNALKDEDYDPSLILRHIALARERGADYIISSHHWGIEHEYYPPKRLVERAHDLCDAGIDLIVGHHPHGLNPVERYRARDGRDCLVFYSLGSLNTYGLISTIHKFSQIAEVVLEAGMGKDGATVVRPRAIALTPVYYSRNRIRGGFEHRLLSLRKGIDALRSGQTPEHYSRKDVRSIRYLAGQYERYFCPPGIEYR